MQKKDFDVLAYEKGHVVKLIEKPTGCLSKYYPLTVGKFYTFLEMVGSCVLITTDDPDIKASIHPSQVEFV